MGASLTAEEERLQEAREGKAAWRQWGPYLSERQWGTVREGYSPEGTPGEHQAKRRARGSSHSHRASAGHLPTRPANEASFGLAPVNLCPCNRLLDCSQ